ncbi:uncharacterized protein BP5553_02437 [Venustampulla echinocandica]|uniref:RNA polymerase II elongation factor ELL N-terminal domain-containing protein n=1 Tax=Venustampulla echinocandica TaxID=2656787 RepID=A0A370U3W8_9HELO|nr:uncharacterized protein BP5553_02437 [Venustampulla echinocandica]RDL42458.1 hypothetical protein BP5553_02437 [Venustampulla echinocandica]
MPSLPIPDGGISLGTSRQEAARSGPAMEVVGLSLADSVIEEMIKCVQHGKPIQLSLGEHPSISYGTRTQHLSTSVDPFTHELYRSTESDPQSPPSPSTMSAQPQYVKKSNHTHPLFISNFHAKFGIKLFRPTPKPGSKPAPVTPVPDPISESTDAALAQLQASLASENARKKENTTKFIREGLPVPGQRGAKLSKKNNKLLSQSTGRSMPSSPAVSGVGSPALGATPTPAPLSQVQQQAEHLKASRKPVIHLLALDPMTEDALEAALPKLSKSDLKQALQKVGDLNETTGKWELRKLWFKELDVWTFKYSSREDRQRVIDNAVKQYDKMRLGYSDPEWDRLLPKSERGSGKCLSKLQGQIRQVGNPMPPKKVKVQKDDKSGRDTSGSEDLFDEKPAPKGKGEGAKSASQGLGSKVKKPSEKEAQAKRLLSKNPTQAKATPAPVKKEKQPKAGTKVLSTEFVLDSDEEDTYMPATKPLPRPIDKKKRSRDEEDETSDSSIPLSKKVKKDVVATSHRISDASQSSRLTNTSTHSSASTKGKNTSPQKSSPLASSPPTNASEFDNSSGNRTVSSSSASPAAHANLKGSRSPIQKRHQKSSSVTSSTSSNSSTRYLKPEVVDLARKYRSFYPTYEALHREIANAKPGSRNSEKENELLDMHSRLAAMKRKIVAGIVEV